MKFDVYETSAGGNKLSLLPEFPDQRCSAVVKINPADTYQEITGIGGSFTQASASILKRLGKQNREQIIEAYFGETGAKYSLTRTHIGSCDFSTESYTYAPVEGDRALQHFSVEKDCKELIPMIKQAMSVSKEGFKIIASPWTAPPWMKDNNNWKGGKLLKDYYETWALYFSKYLSAYRDHGIDIWGITIENEPLGNNNNWESMHFTPQEMNEFLKSYLGPRLRDDGHKIKILGYDQNRDIELIEWVDAMYGDEEAAFWYDGTAVHWYGSTFKVFAAELQYAKKSAPGKHLIQTEATIDAQIPKWKNDQWYWSKNATDWGWDWAPDERKHLHPKYVPVFRYARDLIGTLNNEVDGWIDWNMVLDRQGGPNWAKNWCVAPVIADPDADVVYYTPLYFVMAHFSRFIRPGAVRIGHEQKDVRLQITAVKNPDGTVAVVVLNQNEDSKTFRLEMNEKSGSITIDAKAVQTIHIHPQDQTLKNDNGVN